ncbi:PaaX family transcriptional regulator C-terminal domain-containing protein [Cryobacterium sp. BB307]|uniref:PaaX family transcriptional regulator C-terminal domain-containing protein n=1 Tax=Cryobacterium sp. BB307 TaxID=2716317 RepID=UPI00144678D3
MILDDFDSRAGSATSLLRTIVGAFLRELGGSIRASDLVRLLDAAGVAGPAARTAISRVKEKGLLLADGGAAPGYRLNPDAVPMLERGDRRIFNYRQQGERDPWCLVSYSVPESRRSARHQLRRRLGWIGCGTVADGLWIAPGFLADEVRLILTDLDLQDAATLFTAERPDGLGRHALGWWDLDRLAGLHRVFLDATAHDGSAADEREAFARWTHALDRWRIIPYLDPGLPASVLPVDWPGHQSVERFRELSAALAPKAHAFARRPASSRE